MGFWKQQFSANRGTSVSSVPAVQTMVPCAAVGVSTVFGFEVWVEVQAENAKGWVYDGMAPDVLQGRGHLSRTEDLVLAKAN